MRTCMYCLMLQEHQEHLGQLVTHVDNTSVAEALVRLLGADDQTATFMPPTELAWLQQTDVLQVRPSGCL